jgi:hypothetical protein
MFKGVRNKRKVNSEIANLAGKNISSKRARLLFAVR